MQSGKESIRRHRKCFGPRIEFPSALDLFRGLYWHLKLWALPLVSALFPFLSQALWNVFKPALMFSKLMRHKSDAGIKLMHRKSDITSRKPFNQFIIAVCRCEMTRILQVGS